MADHDDEIVLEDCLDHLPGLKDGTLAQELARLEGRPVDPEEVKVILRCIFDALTPESQCEWLERNSSKRGEPEFNPPLSAPPASETEPDEPPSSSDLARCSITSSRQSITSMRASLRSRRNCGRGNHG